MPNNLFQAIAGPTRREVLKILSREAIPISKITSYFPVSRTAIVKHLHILSESKVSKYEKTWKGKNIFASGRASKHVKEWLSYYEQFWHNKLAILKHLVETMKSLLYCG